MGVSTNGQICFGIAFEEGTEFPWHSDGIIEDWWVYKVHNFKHSKDLYDSEGEYLNGVKPSDAEVTKYYAEYRAFLEAHPIPVKEVNYCSGDYPMWILAVPDSVLSCGRGDPTTFSPSSLSVTEEEKAALVLFCDLYEIETTNEPDWLLTSYWG